MALSPYQLLLSLLGSGAADEYLEEDTPPLEVLDQSFTAYYVDAGARDAPWGDSRAYFLKLAVLARVVKRGEGVEERLFYPDIVAGQGAQLPPVFMGTRGGERVRQAAAYTAELASLLALATGRWKALLEEEGLEAPRPVLLLKHGPLLQVISNYTSRPFVVETGEAERLLEYAGLPRGEARDLIDYSYQCIGGREDRNRVVLGLLAANILAELVERSLSGDTVVGGIVENVSRSRVLVQQVIADIVASAVNDARRRGNVSVDRVASRLSSTVLDGYDRVGNDVAECMGVDRDYLSSLAPSLNEWIELVSGLRETLQVRLQGVGLGNATASDVAKALAWSTGLPDVYDPELLYSIYYLDSSGKKPVTRLIPHTGRTGLLEYYLLGPPKRGECQGEEHWREVVEKIGRIAYRYLAVVEPPKCSELKSKASSLPVKGVEAYELARLVSVPPPIRVERVEGQEDNGLLEAVVLYPARITLYGYPPQLLVVDRYSRLRLLEVVGFKSLLEGLIERMQPYTGFIRGWEARAAATL